MAAVDSPTIARVLDRVIERHCAASLRAESAQPSADYRARQLYRHARPLTLLAPHLNLDAQHFPHLTFPHQRGLADAMAARLRSDWQVHRAYEPSAPMARLLFDTFEQLRCEALMRLPGAKQNIAYAFDRWCQYSRANGIGETEIGLHLYSVIHIVRARLGAAPPSEAVEGLIEAARFQLAPQIGAHLAGMAATRTEQAHYAKYAAELATFISAYTAPTATHPATPTVRTMWRVPLPTAIPNARSESAAELPAEPQTPLAPAHDEYRVFCREFDREIVGADLYDLPQRRALRARLDALIAEQAVSLPAFAWCLRRVFARTAQPRWQRGEEYGYVDASRLSQLVCKPSETRIFMQPQPQIACDTVVSFLLDNSGSMKRQSFAAIAVWVDLYCRALELAGIRTEILGFTTGGWAGGESLKRWRQAGAPMQPGRLNERLHIVYKSAEVSWRRARDAVASLLNPSHYKEGLDGEALQWASQRLAARPEGRKCLVMISDGAPMETATCHHNDADYLVRHLQAQIHHLECARPGTTPHTIELAALAIDLDLCEFFHRSVAIDFSHAGHGQATRAFETLFG